MKSLGWARALWMLAATALCAGCSSSLRPPAGPGVSSFVIGAGVNAFLGAVPHGPAQPDRRKSWISPDAKAESRLLFASDSGLNELDIYSLPNMKLKGQITGLDDPQGMCSDTAGNVYVAEPTGEVAKYSRTGSLLAAYADNYGFAVGCAVDPATGNLAVTDLLNYGSGPGQVLVFSSPSSQPTVLSNPSQYWYYFAGYGPGSTLWVSGMDASDVYMLSRCVALSCTTINVSGGTLYYPGAVQWDNAHGTWVVFDQMCDDKPAACSYPVSASGVLARPTAYKNYKGGDDCDLIQGEIVDGKYVVGSDNEYCRKAPSTFDRWAYPSGGKPTNYAILSNPYSVPNGVAVSTK